MKIFFVTTNFDAIRNSGAYVVTSRNLWMLKNLEENANVDVFHLTASNNKLIGLYNNLLGYMGRLTPRTEKEVLEKIENGNYQMVFLDSSLNGRLTKAIKQVEKKTTIIQCFHNIEYQYFFELLKSTKKIWHIISIFSARFNEELTLKYADYLLFVNKRDRELVAKKIQGQKSLILPISYRDNFDAEKNRIIERPKKKRLLFVGTLFFPNYHGIKWFIKNVSPYVDAELYIVGKNFEQKREELERENVKVIGTVDELDTYYYSADIIIAPIFQGGGMKTKTAEALMYGKTILGTKEAFEGYGFVDGKVMISCNNADEFICAINNYKEDNVNIEKARTFFIENYSHQSSLIKFKSFINSPDNAE